MMRLSNLLREDSHPPQPFDPLLDGPLNHVTIPPMRMQRDINALLDVPLSTSKAAAPLRSQSGLLPSIGDATGTGASVGSGAQATRKSTKPSALPLAEVLNSNSPKPRKAAAHTTFAYRDGEMGRKKRKLDAEDPRMLPKPAFSTKKEARKKVRLPPVLAPLHDPPVGERLVPSMMGTDGLLDPMLEIESMLNQDPRPFEKELPTPLSKAKEAGDAAKVKAKAKKTSDDASSSIGHGNNKVIEVKRTSVKKKWTTEETVCLVSGVAKFGIGNWKKILDDPELQFNQGRNAMDLKDRFRTCFPDEYRKNGSQKGRIEYAVDVTGKKKGRGARTNVALGSLGVNDRVPFPNNGRRLRTTYTEEEDQSLLRGFQKYQAQWKKIQSDPELGLAHRTRTDLRDRFRNRFRDEFKEAGYKHKLLDAKEKKPVQHDGEPVDELLELLEPQPVPQSSQEDTREHPLRLLTTSIYDVFDPGLISPQLAEDDDDDEDESPPLQLSRNILYWADQNTTRITNVAETRTLTSLDQYHINPLVVHNKPPALFSTSFGASSHLQLRHAQQQSQGQSVVPLSRILNETRLDDRPLQTQRE